MSTVLFVVSVKFTYGRSGRRLEAQSSRASAAPPGAIGVARRPDSADYRNPAKLTPMAWALTARPLKFIASVFRHTLSKRKQHPWLQIILRNFCRKVTGRVSLTERVDFTGRISGREPVYCFRGGVSGTQPALIFARRQDRGGGRR